MSNNDYEDYENIGLTLDEHYGDALAGLEATIASDVTLCPWLTYEQCLQQSIRGVLNAANLHYAPTNRTPLSGPIEF
jgi:hypothetical protein